MTMTMTRKGFLGAATGGAILLLLQACGGGGDDNNGGTPSSGTPSSGTPGGTPSGTALTQCGSSGADISGNHGHTLSIPVADLDSAVDKTYSIAGSASHDHTVTFTPDQLKQLKAGQTVTVGSSTSFQHAHNVTPSCS